MRTSQQLLYRAFFAMPMRLSVEKLNGETLCIEVRDSQTVAELGLSANPTVTAVLRENVVHCSKWEDLSDDDPELSVVVKIRDSDQIEGCAFEGCNRVTKVIISDSVRRIGSYAFRNCRSLISVTIPESVAYIGDCAFEGCSSLTHISIPGSVTLCKGQRAFAQVAPR